jgi:hypothetical protein
MKGTVIADAFHVAGFQPYDKGLLETYERFQYDTLRLKLFSCIFCFCDFTVLEWNVKLRIYHAQLKNQMQGLLQVDITTYYTAHTNITNISSRINRPTEG